MEKNENPDKIWYSYEEWKAYEEFCNGWELYVKVEPENLERMSDKPKIDIQEVKKLYEEDMKKYEDIHNAVFVDFSDYCKELEILFEITY